jgi:hypothetical protein
MSQKTAALVHFSSGVIRSSKTMTAAGQLGPVVSPVFHPDTLSALSRAGEK